MIQKKICMVGVFGVGKTCLVQQFVHSIFSAKYHSTVGVKIDRKALTVDGTEVTLLLWDLAGRDGQEDISVSYLRGSHGILYVVDGTRRETFDQAFELHDLARDTIGDVPSAVALNKHDLTGEWVLTASDEERLAGLGWHAERTSAKTGMGVEASFGWLARAALGAGGGT
ncbi:MAG TPA: Rab family GTPase [Gemmatimonadales bacterium]|nr:Rab family GTPase [Gemmatimonadales bacterium]